MRYLKTCPRFSSFLLLIMLAGLLGACAELSTPTPAPVGPPTAEATATAPVRALATVPAAPAQPTFTTAAATTAIATTAAAVAAPTATPPPPTATTGPAPSPVVAATATPAKAPPATAKAAPTARTAPTPGKADSKSDEVSVSILTVNGNLPGRVASVTIQTSPLVECTIVYLDPAKQANPAKGLSPQTANQDGRITWTWLISPQTTPGKGSVTVTCGDNSETRLITIG